jgi:hypothetical protein
MVCDASLLPAGVASPGPADASGCYPSASLVQPEAQREPAPALVEAALAYARLGWPVIPLAPRGKVPLIPREQGGRGVHDAVTDADRIKAWWSACPNANVGLACGVAFWVLDVDYKGWRATAPDGLDTYAAMVDRYGRPPATTTQITGGGGFQFFLSPDGRVNNGVRFLPGTDTRSAGGYVVAPPSIHPGGGTYRWCRGHGPDEVAIATAPEWLVCLVEPVETAVSTAPAPGRLANVDRYGAAALERACAAVAAAGIGTQEAVLNREAFGIGRLAAGGVVSAGTARANLVAAGCRMVNQRGRRPWTAAELARRVDRAFAAATASSRTLEAR